jgi:hypothetical protein
VNSGDIYPFSADGLRVSIINGYIRSVPDGMNGLLGNPGNFFTHSVQNCN